jgi:hypothetical protein
MEKGELKILIRKVELDQPSADFTGEIMQELKGHHDYVSNPALRAVLQRNSKEILPSDFTRRVMYEVTSENQIVFKPIISKKAWIIISGCLLSIIVFLGFIEDGLPVSGIVTSHFITVGSSLQTLFKSTSSLWLITSVSVSVLLILDYLLGQVARNQDRKTSTSS